MASRIDATGAPAAVTAPAFERLWFDPAGTACETPDGPLARRDFLARADALATALPGQGAGLLACSDTLNFALGLCALLRTGRDVLLPPNLQPETLADAAFDDAVTLDDAFVAAGGSTPATDPAPLDANQRITLFTSGSTGRPRRVEKRLRQLSAEADLLEAGFGAMLGDAAVAASVPHFHIYGMLFRVIWPLAHGRAFHAQAQPDANLPAGEGHALVSSPAFLGRIDVGRLAECAPRVIFSSGGRLPAKRAREVATACRAPLVEVYGSTETGGIAWREWGPDCDGLWTPFQGTRLQFGDNDMLEVRSPATDDQWTRTGDRATPAKENARFRLEGRADGVLKIEDKRVSPRALIDALESHPWIVEAHLVELDGKRRQLGAVVQLAATGREALDRHGRGGVARTFKTLLSRRFEAVVVPRKWRFVDAVPVNAMGKTTREALLALFETGAA